jgi:hypothetical protein
MVLFQMKIYGKLGMQTCGVILFEDQVITYIETGALWLSVYNLEFPEGNGKRYNIGPAFPMAQTQ